MESHRWYRYSGQKTGRSFPTMFHEREQAVQLQIHSKHHGNWTTRETCRCNCTNSNNQVLQSSRGSYKNYLFKSTRIPSGIWSRLYGSFPSALNKQEAWLNTHGQKFDPKTLYDPIKFETLQPYLVNIKKLILILDSPLTLTFWSV